MLETKQNDAPDPVDDTNDVFDDNSDSDEKTVVRPNLLMDSMPILNPQTEMTTTPPTPTPPPPLTAKASVASLSLKKPKKKKSFLAKSLKKHVKSEKSKRGLGDKESADAVSSMKRAMEEKLGKIFFVFINTV